MSVEEFALRLVEILINHPFSKICKHQAALEVLNLLEKNGVDINETLVRAIVDCDDEAAITILKGE